MNNQKKTMTKMNPKPKKAAKNVEHAKKYNFTIIKCAWTKQKLRRRNGALKKPEVFSDLNKTVNKISVLHVAKARSLRRNKIFNNNVVQNVCPLPKPNRISNTNSVLVPRTPNTQLLRFVEFYSSKRFKKDNPPSVRLISVICAVQSHPSLFRKEWPKMIWMIVLRIVTRNLLNDS